MIVRVPGSDRADVLEREREVWDARSSTGSYDHPRLRPHARLTFLPLR
jgi:hypothetical protein